MKRVDIIAILFSSAFNSMENCEFATETLCEEYYCVIFVGRYRGKYFVVSRDDDSITILNA